MHAWYFFLDWHKICAKISFSLLLHELLRIDRNGPRDWWRWAGACRVQTRTPTGQLPTWSSLTAGYKRLIITFTLTWLSDIIWWALMSISTHGHGNQLDNLHLIQDDLRWHIRNSMTMTEFAFDIYSNVLFLLVDYIAFADLSSIALKNYLLSILYQFEYHIRLI